MNRLQTITLSLLAGLVIVVFIALAALIILLPAESLPIIIVTPTASSTPTSPPLPTSTLPSFLPTPNIAITLSPEPTMTNTRVPSPTPRPPRTATPTTVMLKVPTPIILPSKTPTPTTAPLPLPTAVRDRPIPTRMGPLSYRVEFTTKEPVIEQGECTDLEWRVEGGVSVTLDGSFVDFSGSKEVCPDKEKSYRLVVQLPNNSGTEIREVKIKVDEGVPDIDDD